MKKALIGLSNNVKKNISKIKLWATSFMRHCDGQVILLCANSTEEDIKLCKDIGITPIQVVVNDTWYINHERLKHTYEYLNSSDIDLFIATDVFDVAFQGNPFDKLDTSIYDLFVSGEGINVDEEPWNSDNINKIFPESLQVCKKTEVINSGIIAGKREALSSLLSNMYKLCEMGSSAHNIKDQAALIVMVSKNEIERLKIFNLDDGWAMHCAVAGPTQFFEGWGFRNKIKYGIPYMQDNHVINKFGKRYDMVHQFNRVPEWHEIIKRENKL
jgi:hypothetical protein